MESLHGLILHLLLKIVPLVVLMHLLLVSCTERSLEMVHGRYCLPEDILNSGLVVDQSRVVLGAIMLLLQESPVVVIAVIEEVTTVVGFIIEVLLGHGHEAETCGVSVHPNLRHLHPTAATDVLVCLLEMALGLLAELVGHTFKLRCLL